MIKLPLIENINLISTVTNYIHKTRVFGQNNIALTCEIMAASKIEEKIIFQINIAEERASEYGDYIENTKEMFYVTMPKNYKNSRCDFVIEKVKAKFKYLKVNKICWTDMGKNKISIDDDQDFENALEALEAMDLSINKRKDGAQSVTPIYKLQIIATKL